MTIYHWDLPKKKRTGGSKRAFRGKRKYESGNIRAETRISATGELVNKRRIKGGGIKLSIKESKHANVSFPDGHTVRAEIISLVDNPSNALYARRGIICKGAVLRTSEGTVRVTSKTGSDGVLNAKLIEEKK
jgi:small subunit ribosomal protein S8e